jgi:uncharacterized membrane protein
MVIRIFLILHWIGLVLVAVGCYLWFFADATSGNVTQMVWTATTLGLGGLLMSPYPVVKAFEWMSRK